eukprot:gene14327-16942_t
MQVQRFFPYVLAIAIVATLPAARATEWSVLSKQFSAVSIGIAFESDTTGWTTFTDGSSAPKIVKTNDSGVTWNPVNDSGTVLIATGFAAKKLAATRGSAAAGTLVGMAGVPLTTKYSTDGENFKGSLFAPVTSQSIKYQNKRFVMASTDGACLSSEGRFYKCTSKAPLKYPGTARYASSPSDDVIYLTAGQWPSKQQDADGGHPWTRNLRIRADGSGLELLSMNRTSEEGLDTDEPGVYTAELWKSVDGGKTWSSLFHSEGEFYFNDIDCIDDTTCVAVGEGYSADGSTAPGARVYITTDGASFKQVYQADDGASLMAARMMSKSEHFAGGSTKAGGLLSPVLALHTTDGGKTYVNEHGNVVGNSITAFDFISSDHGYATTVNALQVSSLLEYGSTPELRAVV